MSVLTVKELTHGFGDRAIFEDVSFRLLKGEHVGLIGANGEGKSTFMNIITGSLMPDEGTVEWSNRVRVGYLDQHAKLIPGQTIREVLRSAFAYLYAMEEEIIAIGDAMADADEKQMERFMEEMGTLQDLLDHNGFYTIESTIEEVAAGLGLRDLGLEHHVEELSGGQRTKVLMAKLLLEKPDILLLDEPTNYLDEEHIRWLTEYLQNYENAFILISHDLPFLDRVINVIYHVEERTLTRYVGNYQEFEALRDARLRQVEAAYARQQKEIARLEEFVARNKARVATANMAKSRQKKLDKMDRIELTKEKPKPVFEFMPGKTTGKLIFETKGLVIGYDHPLTRPLDLYVERGQRIALTGANGLGKTTLLKSLMGLIEPLEGSVELGEHQQLGYFEQEQEVKDHRTCLEDYWALFPGNNQFEVRSALAKCGLTTSQIESQVKVLSGGEKAKLRLAKLMNQPTNILLLDEPTNHLDPDAKEELAKALAQYKGTLILVCHEPEFYRKVVQEVWSCEDWTLKVY
ncbi:ABC transporter ATP-binding protein [Clostridiaceae bacterium JG1575]|nr:ABC transporter ATP-binding protein [Clostridiaceae bacterium JG1575]